MRKCQDWSPQLHRSLTTSASAVRRVLIGLSVAIAHLPDIASVAFNFAVHGVQNNHVHVAARAVARGGVPGIPSCKCAKRLDDNAAQFGFAGVVDVAGISIPVTGLSPVFRPVGCHQLAEHLVLHGVAVRDTDKAAAVSDVVKL